MKILYSLLFCVSLSGVETTDADIAIILQAKSFKCKLGVSKSIGVDVRNEGGVLASSGSVSLPNEDSIIVTVSRNEKGKLIVGFRGEKSSARSELRNVTIENTCLHNSATEIQDGDYLMKWGKVISGGNEIKDGETGLFLVAK